MSTLAPIDLPPIDQQIGGDGALLHLELESIIKHDIAFQPRSLQKRIGPSEIGDPCVRCLGFKLAGIEPIPEAPGSAWLPYVGTAMHSQLADVFTSLNDGMPSPRWLVEMAIDAGVIDGVPLTGHSDLFDRMTATVVDWKLVGATTLKEVNRHGPSQTYRVQGHTYGRGFVRRGLEVDRVAIYFLPRNALNLGAGFWWSEKYDESIAIEYIDRADALASAIRLAGPEAVIPHLEAAPKCRTCPRFYNLDGSMFTHPSRPSVDPDDPFGFRAA